MISILSKLGSEYSVFVSTFHSGRASIRNWKMPSLDAFVESLIQEQDKLVQMGVIQTSKNQALLMTDSNDAQERGKHKWKESKTTVSNPKENQRYSDGASVSNKKNKFDKAKCPYYMRGFHPERQCMNKTSDQPSTLLKKNNVSLPQEVKKYDAGELIEYHVRCHAMKAGLS